MLLDPDATTLLNDITKQGIDSAIAAGNPGQAVELLRLTLESDPVFGRHLLDVYLAEEAAIAAYLKTAGLV